MLPSFRSMEAFFNLSLPKDRQSLSDRQLLFFFSLLSQDRAMEENLTLCLFKWAGLLSFAILTARSSSDMIHRCISIKHDFYKVSASLSPPYQKTRRMKLLDSNEIRQLRDVCIFEVNGIEVYM